MRLAALTLILLVGCPAQDNVAADYIDESDSGADVGDDAGVGDGEPAAEDDAGPVELDPDDDAGAGPVRPTPTLELTCSAEPGDTCPTWVAGFSGDLLCSPQDACSIRCDVLAPCRPNAGTPPGELADAWRECARKDVESPKFKPDEAAVTACAGLGGACADIYEDNGLGLGHDGNRSWCLPL